MQCEVTGRRQRSQGRRLTRIIATRQVRERIKELRAALDLAPAIVDDPPVYPAAPRPSDPFLRTEGERAAARSRLGTDKDGISVVDPHKGTLRPPAFPPPAWSRPRTGKPPATLNAGGDLVAQASKHERTGAPPRPSTPAAISSLRPRIMMHRSATEAALSTAAAASDGTLDAATMQRTLDGIGITVSGRQMQEVLRSMHTDASGRCTPLSLFQALRLAEEERPPRQQARLNSLLKQLEEFDTRKSGVLTEAQFLNAVKTPTQTIRLFLDPVEVKRLLQATQAPFYPLPAARRYLRILKAPSPPLVSVCETACTRRDDRRYLATEV